MASLHKRLVELRTTSSWHTQEEFSHQIGLELRTYKAVESGRFIPSKKAMQRLLMRLRLREETQVEIWELWGRAKLEREGVTLPESYTRAADLDALAKKIQSEVSYALKQDGVLVRDTTERVIRNRISMILKSALGE